MKEINERFKDADPRETIEKIQRIIKSLGLELVEEWFDSGIEDCWSLRVSVKDAPYFGSNGKGITKQLAQASAYGEFIERLQCDLHLYKLQSIDRNPDMNLQNYAPDGKYMTIQELEENGEWMDYIIQSYGHGLTRKKLAAQCKAYACTEHDQIWTVPFYSLFEKKYVYLPASFVKQIYAANGCCAGNSPQEACVHALSEIMERRCTINVLSSGAAVPPISDEVLSQFPTASKIIAEIRSSGRYDVQLFDFSSGNGFPVIASRIIDKDTHRYNVNVCADPVLEIAIDRTLTELMQGRNIHNYYISHNGSFLNEAKNISMAQNVFNQLESGNGLFSVDFFSEEISCSKKCTTFDDLHEMNNHELLAYMLEMYRKLGRPIYIRNQSFLGFNTYMIVVPGFSEARSFNLIEPVSEYALGDMVYNNFRDVAAASNAELAMLLNFHAKISAELGRVNSFSRLAGLTTNASLEVFLTRLTLSYAAYRLGRYPEAINHLNQIVRNPQLSDDDKAYFSCLQRYLMLKQTGAEESKIRLLLAKLYRAQDVDKLFEHLLNKQTPYDEYLIRCDCKHCENCRYQNDCAQSRAVEIIQQVGKHYQAFVDGQKAENFCKLLTQ